MCRHLSSDPACHRSSTVATLDDLSLVTDIIIHRNLAVAGCFRYTLSILDLAIDDLAGNTTLTDLYCPACETTVISLVTTPNNHLHAVKSNRSEKPLSGASKSCSLPPQDRQK